MRVVTVVSPKGGVGKTTVSLNLAYALAHRGSRVLLVDADPQGAIGQSLGRADDPGLVEHVFRDAPLDGALIKTRLEQLTLLPIGRVAFEDTQAFGEEMADGTKLTGLFARVHGRFDVILVDTAPGFGGLTLGTLRAADAALSPLQAEPLAARAIAHLLEVMGVLRDEGRRVKLTGFVLSMLQQRNADSLSVAEEVWSGLPANLVFDTVVPRDPIFLSASRAGVPVGLLRRRPPPIASVFDQLAMELEDRIDLRAPEDDDGPIPLIA